MKEMIRLVGITKEFEQNTIIPTLDLTIGDGEFVTLLGPSGCGKTTILRMIAGLEHPTTGHIYLDDEDVTSLAPYKRNVNMVFQHYALFPHMTVKKNITLAPVKLGLKSQAEADEQAMALLERIGLADKANEYPNMLSGGQKQRIAIVRALCMEPDVLCFDEPTSALDPETERTLIARLRRHAAGRTLLFVTHHPALAAECDATLRL